jgi:hypothetical protein
MELLPLLQIQRELLALPRGTERFRAYLAKMLAGGDVVLPLTAMNPMAREHVARFLDELGDAEKIARAALAKLPFELELRVGLVVADERGGWTNRWTTDFSHRFEQQSLLARGFCVVLLWAGERPEVRREVIAAVARAHWQRSHPPPKSLREMVAQENFARTLTGEAQIEPPREDARDAPTLFALLYGDEAAEALGYAKLGASGLLR